MTIGRSDYCPLCKRWLDTAHAIEQHNIIAAYSGERSYDGARGVPARTVEAAKVRQGGSGHGRGGLQ